MPHKIGSSSPETLWILCGWPTAWSSYECSCVCSCVSLSATHFSFQSRKIYGRRTSNLFLFAHTIAAWWHRRRWLSIWSKATTTELLELLHVWFRLTTKNNFSMPCATDIRFCHFVSMIRFTSRINKSPGWSARYSNGHIAIDWQYSYSYSLSLSLSRQGIRRKIFWRIHYYACDTNRKKWNPCDRQASIKVFE